MNKKELIESDSHDSEEKMQNDFTDADKEADGDGFGNEVESEEVENEEDSLDEEDDLDGQNRDEEDSDEQYDEYDSDEYYDEDDEDSDEYYDEDDADEYDDEEDDDSDEYEDDSDEYYDEDDEDSDEYYEDEEEYSEDELEQESGKGGNKKSMKKLLIVLGSTVAVLAAVYVGVSIFFTSHFFMNTEINGHEFSAKTVSDVETYMKQQVKGYKLKVLEKDNKTDIIDGNAISLSYKKTDEIQKALDKQNGFLWPVSFFSKNTAKVTIKVSYDETALDEVVKNMQSVKAEQIASQSAAPKFDGEKYVIEPEIIGTAVNMETLNDKVHTSIAEFRPELDMEKENCYEKPKFTKESEEVKKAVDTLNNYCKASITYTMTEPVVVDKALISTWLSVDENMNVVFNEEGVRAWLTEFGNKFDTVGATRTITTPTGKTAEVSGGTYGWSTDEDVEFTALTEHIKKGETVSKEPAYYQTAAAHAATDWGNTYLEVDLSAQYMWYVVNGAVVLETDVVTGYPSPEKETPSGVYSILEMQRNKTLVGEIVPETGKPEYETPVSFWMRATWSGIGFHDATWQPAFGGSLYTSIGSHGCINMPYDQADALYGMLGMGTPVIMHY